MKKLRPKVRKYAPVLAKMRMVRRLREALKRRERRRAKHPYYADCLHLPAPTHFSVSETRHRKNLLSFLRKLRTRIAVMRKPLRIDFRPTQRMVSCGTLLFVAELDRCIRSVAGRVRVSYQGPRDKIVAQVLQQVGITALLGSKRRQDGDSFDPTVRHWRFATGVHADATKFDELLGDFEGRIAPALSQSIFKGVTEAMTNCAQHAYHEPRRDGTNIRDERRWWMFSEEVEGNLHVAFCDLGMGIPRSLPKIDESAAPGWMGMLRDFLSSFKPTSQEAAMIKAAIEIGRSRTNQPHRGLGLNQIVETAKVRPGSRVLIMSNHGAYDLEPARLMTEQLVQFDDSIMGTLIQWSMPVQNKDERNGANDGDDPHR
ncbi:hypothetical protein LLG90_19735 [Aromatoleum toluclasticum]|uniref:hypothetical protein n=1 Tax=Aromatoleum toluclasticum TaxID=92003 RepID=UPI001D185B44|nr:hypothetical protein [Aromatoleum toluclasticum]MCC4117594.1 hypothetical protein [Aromatoleum toluclasticum]